MRALPVARVSKEDQARGLSIDAQVREMVSFCERNQIEVVEVLREPGTSAFTNNIDKIPALRRALEMIEAGQADILMVHESSRLARNTSLGDQVMERLNACSGHLIDVAMGGIDYSTPEGRLIFDQSISLNAYFSRKISQHSKKGKRQQFEVGLHVGAIPFGYTHATTTAPDGLVVTTRKEPMLIVPHEAEAIRKAYDDLALGKSAPQIAREWNALGLKPRSVKGITYFQPQTVRDILSNRVYIGDVQHLGQWHKGRHEPILTDAQFWAAQKPKKRMIRGTHPPRLLAGVATCPEGHRVYVIAVNHSAKNKERKHYYYREPSRDFERLCSQSGALWRAPAVDEQVEALLKTMALDEQWLRFVENEARKSPQRDTAQERARITAKIDRLQDEYLEGRVPKAKWEKIFAECQRLLAELPAGDLPLTQVHQRLTSWVDLWDSASPETRNETCKLVFREAVIDFAQKSLELAPWPEFEPLFDARLHYVTQGSPGRGSR